MLNLKKLHLISRDKILAFCSCFVFFLSSLDALIFALTGSNNSTSTYFFLLIKYLIIFIGMMILFYKNKVNTKFVFIYLAVCILFSISIFKGNTNLYPFLKHSFASLTINIFVASFVINLCNIDLFFNYLETFSKIYLFLFSIILIFLLNNGLVYLMAQAKNGSYMAFSYSILPFVCYYLYKIFYFNNKIKNTVIFFIYFLIMSIWGSRGAILSVLVYGFILLIRNWLNKKRIIRLILFFTITFIMMLNITNLISSFKMYLHQNFSINSYALTQLLGNNTTSGRYGMYVKLLEELDNNPFFKGINSDYILFGGIYCHNIYLEILYNCGGIIGSLIIIAIICLIIFTLINKNNKIANYTIYFFAISHTKLLFSSSPLLEVSFFIWLGLLARQIKKINLRNLLDQKNIVFLPNHMTSGR